WDKGRQPLRPVGSSGIWEAVVPDAREGSHYKYHVASRFQGYATDRVDPVGFMHSPAPAKESIVRRLDYEWADADWMAARAERQKLDRPMSIYEMHVGSWMRTADGENRPLAYRELAPKLADYLTDRGFTHVEFLPVMEHPFYGSW